MGISIGEVKKNMNDTGIANSILKACISARISLINAASHLGAASMHTDFKEDPKCLSGGVPTMGTDGVYIYYHPDLLTQNVYPVDHNELVSIIAHETYHNLLLHTHESRRGKPGDRNPMLWNYACDYAVNAILVDEGFKLNKHWLYKEEWKTLCAEEIYNILKKEHDKNMQKFLKMIGEGKLADMHMPFGGENGEEKDKDQKAGRVGGVDSDQLAEEWKKHLIDAMTQKEFMDHINGNNKNQGTMSGELEEVINSIKRVKTNVVEMLSNHITRRITDRANWNRPNKRWLASTGQYWPSKLDDSISLGIFLDTSGSVSNEDAGFFLGIVHEIISRLPVKWLRYMEVDTSVKKDITMDGDIVFPEPKVKGRGGTDFRHPFKKLEEDAGNYPDAVIYLTDGYGTFPEEQPPYPVLWVYNHKDRGADPPWGDVTKFDRRDAVAYGYGGEQQQDDIAAGDSPSP